MTPTETTAMAVNETLREAMSAVMDGEGSDMDLARILKAVESEPDARHYWQRLQEAQTVRRTGRSTPAIDVSDAVQLALTESVTRRRAGPLASLAVAASVTLGVVFGGQTLLNDAGGGSAPAVQLPGGVVPVQGVAPVQARFGGNQGVVTGRQQGVAQPSNVTRVYEQLARERMQRFGSHHAESTATIQPNVLVPYVRLPDDRR